MLKEERQKFILDRLSKSQKVNFAELEKHLNVSYDSIRRDVIELEDKGMLKKVYGGIVANSYFQTLSAGDSGDFNGSTQLEQLVKKAVKLVKPNETILMDGGITNFHIARHLPKHISATIVTNSPPLAVALNDHQHIEVIILGGRYFKKYQITMGAETMAQLDQIYVDTYFLGVNGIHHTKGLSVRNYEEGTLKRRMIQQAKRTISCCIDEKIGNSESFVIAPISALDQLVTNLKPTDSLLEDLRLMGLNII